MGAGAVANADLSFSTRRVAEQAPKHLRDQARVDVACGIAAALQDIDVESALDRLKGAAQRAGIPMNRVGDIVITLNGS